MTVNDLDYGQATQAWLQAFESGQEIVDTVVLHKLQSSLLMNKLPLPWQVRHTHILHGLDLTPTRHHSFV